MLTKEEWLDPNCRCFSNAEIPNYDISQKNSKVAKEQKKETQKA